MADSDEIPDVMRVGHRPPSACLPREPKLYAWRKYLLIPVIFLYFSSYYMGTTMTEKYIEFRVTEDIMQEMDIKDYVDLSAMSFCNVTSTELLLMMIELQIRLSPLREWLTIASVLPAFVSTLILGPVVDRFGRRWALVLPICGTFARAAGYALVSQTKASLYFLYIVHAIEGALGYFPTVLLASFAIASDITDKDKSRTTWFTVIDAVAAIGQASYLGQIALIQRWSFTTPNVLTMLVALSSLILVVFIPCTRPTNLTPSSVAQSFKQMGRFFVCPLNRNRWTPFWFYICLLIFTVASLTFYGRQIIEPVVSEVPPLCWDMAYSGNFVVFRTIGQCLAVVAFVKLLQPFLPDAGIAVLAALLQMAGFIVEGFGTSTWIMCLAAGLGLASGAQLSMGRVMLSKLPSCRAYGALFAVIACIESLTSGLSSAAFVSFYDHFFALQKPGAVFFFMASLTALVLILYGFLFFVMKWHAAWREESIVTLSTKISETDPLLTN